MNQPFNTILEVKISKIVDLAKKIKEKQERHLKEKEVISTLEQREKELERLSSGLEALLVFKARIMENDTLPVMIIEPLSQFKKLVKAKYNIAEKWYRDIESALNNEVNAIVISLKEKFEVTLNELQSLVDENVEKGKNIQKRLEDSKKIYFDSIKRVELFILQFARDASPQDLSHDDFQNHLGIIASNIETIQEAKDYVDTLVDDPDIKDLLVRTHRSAIGVKENQTIKSLIEKAPKLSQFEKFIDTLQKMKNQQRYRNRLNNLILFRTE